MTAFKRGTIFKAWCIFFVMAAVGGLIAGAIAGGVTGVIVVIVTGSKEAIPFYAGLAGFLAGIPISYLCFDFAVNKFLASEQRPTD